MNVGSRMDMDVLFVVGMLTNAHKLKLDKGIVRYIDSA